VCISGHIWRLSMPFCSPIPFILCMLTWANLRCGEALFFLATNVLIVFGLVTFDYAVALVTAFLSQYQYFPARISQPDRLCDCFSSQVSGLCLLGLSQPASMGQSRSLSKYWKRKVAVSIWPAQCLRGG
jgi:hypothetical protein